MSRIVHIAYIVWLLLPPSAWAGGNWIPAGMDGKAVTSVAVHPTEAEVVFAGVQEGGLYVSRDGGKTWSGPSFSKDIVLCIAFDRWQTGVVYIGTTKGLKRSHDAGNYFTDAGSLNRPVTCIAIDESQSKALVLGTPEGVYRSFDYGRTFQSAGLKEHVITCLAIAKTVPKPTVFAGTEQGGVFRSANFGMSWSSANGGISPEDMQLHSVLCNLKKPSNIIVSTLGGGLFVSENLGDTWDPVSSEIPHREGYVLNQAVDPKSNKIVLYATSYSGSAFRSRDDGASWQKIGDPIPNVVGLCVGISNVLPTTLYLGTLSGLYKIQELR